MTFKTHKAEKYSAILEALEIHKEATRIERERCLKAVEDAWKQHMEECELFGMDRSHPLKVAIKAKIEAGTTGGV